MISANGASFTGWRRGTPNEEEIETDKTGKTDDIELEGEETTGYVTDVMELAVATRELYRKYVAFHSDYAAAQSGCMTLFTFYTYVYEEFRFAPILLVTAPTSEAGKSRLFDVAELVIRQPFVVVDPSGPALRNIIDLYHPTIMVDEADLLRQSKDLRVILNAGVEQGTLITRAGRNGAVITYDPFGPKMLAGIHGEQPPLKGSTLSRAIQIQLRRRFDGREEIADFDKSDAEIESIEISGALRKWAKLTSRDALRRARPDLPAELTDRQRDAWRPLIVIADLIGEHWGSAARDWAVELSRAVPETPDLMVQVLKDCYRVLASPEHRDTTMITSRTLAAERNALPDREFDEDLSPIQLGKRLARFDIKPDRFTNPKKQEKRRRPQVRGYRIRGVGGRWVPEWADVIGRYRLAED